MEFGKVILLSLLEGLTEFIPVSSTGHLILLSSYLGNSGETEKLFEVFIQLGAVLAVVMLYFEKLIGLIKQVFERNLTKDNIPYTYLGIIVACLPSMAMGFLFYKIIKSYLFYPRPVAIALIVGGVGLILVEKYCSKDGGVNINNSSTKISIKQSFVVGLFQCFALWPGMSRSGSCIIGARIAGISRTLSAEFSFIVALPIMLVAVVYDILKNLNIFFSPFLSLFLIGFVVSFITGALSIKLLISYLQKFSLIPFGIYRIILGLAVLLLIER